MKLNGLQYRRWQFLKTWRSDSLRTLYYLCVALGTLSLIYIFISLFIIRLPASAFGLSIGLLSPFLAFVAVDLYAKYLERNPNYYISPGMVTANPLNKLDYNALELVVALQKSRTWEQFWASAQRRPMIGEVTYRLGFTPEVANQIYSGPVGAGVADATASAAIHLIGESQEQEMVSEFHVLAILLGAPEVETFLKQEKINPENIQSILGYYQSRQEALTAVIARQKNGGFAKTWAVSYTNLLDEVAGPLSPHIRANVLLTPIYLRESLLKEITNALIHSGGANVLLTGEAGIGKKELFYHFASAVLNYQTNTELDGCDVRILDVERLLSLASSEAPLTQVVGTLFGELARAGNVILFIDQIDLLFSPNQALGTTDVSNLLEGYLASPNIKIIGTMTPEHYLEDVKPNPLLSKNFSVLEVPSPSPKDLVGIVLSHIDGIEYRYSCFFPLTAINELIALANRYLKNDISPQREVHLAEEVAVEAHSSNKKLVTEDLVTKVVERLSKVPIKVEEQERTTLLNLAEELHKRIIGQNTAIKEVSDALLRARAGMSSANRPIGSFLFLGPTGVGKTETAKALADIYFGSEKRMARLDMSEYADQNGLEKLLGTNPTTDPGALPLAIQENPSTVVLFDEIEKASNLVRNALLQLLDEGRLTTNYGKVLDFTNTIVIATSNAGSDFIRTQIEHKIDVKAFEKQLVDQLITQKIYLPEFLNRFDGVIVYTPLSQSEIAQVVKLQVAQLTQQIKQEKGINLVLSDQVVGELAKRGYDPVFGARALRRVIEQDLETRIAKEIITQNPQPDSTLSINTL